MVATRKWTVEELAAEPPQGRWELIDGELVAMTPSGAEASTAGSNLDAMVNAHVRRHRLGFTFNAEGGFRPDPASETLRSPDVAFVAKDRLPKERQTGFFDGAPDLTVEVISPSETATEVEAKVRDYLAAGTKLVWLVYPDEKMVRVHRPDGTTALVQADGRLSGEELLPGFELALDELWGEKE